MLPLIEPHQPPSTRSAKTAAGGRSSARQFWTDGQCRHECRHGTLKARATSLDRLRAGRYWAEAGRGAFLKRKLHLSRDNPIRHGAAWCWVDGLVDIEKLTSRDLKQIRLNPARKKEGNFPAFLTTNHFCAEGRWSG